MTRLSNELHEARESVRQLTQERDVMAAVRKEETASLAALRDWMSARYPMEAGRDCCVVAQEKLAKYELLRQAINESDDACTPECNSYGHSDACRTLEPSFIIEGLQARLAALEADGRRQRQRTLAAVRVLSDAIDEADWMRVRYAVVELADALTPDKALAAPSPTADGRTPQ